VAAKLMILSKPSPTPPMGQYYIEHRRSGSAETAFSSLAPGNKSGLWLRPPSDEYPSKKSCYAAQTCNDDPYPQVRHNIDHGTPGSKTDSEATMTLEQWEELNKLNGMDLDSKLWNHEATAVGETQEMKVKAVDKTKVRPK
jgi:hypothetical protein